MSNIQNTLAGRGKAIMVAVSGCLGFIMITCGLIFAVGYGVSTWFDGGPVYAQPPVRAVYQPVQQVSAPPVQLGYATADEAQRHCKDGGTVTPNWRNYQIVGYGCNRDMSK
jgi:hypothetical protein